MKGLAMVVRTLWRQPKARIGLLFILALAVMAVLAPVISPYSPQTATFPVMSGPSSANLLGTTGGGQDVLSQLIYGARDSLMNLLLVIPALPLMIIISTYSKGGGIWTIVLIIALLASAFALLNFGVDELSNPRLREV